MHRRLYKRGKLLSTQLPGLAALLPRWELKIHYRQMGAALTGIVVLISARCVQKGDLTCSPFPTRPSAVI